ncbi:hypothetical protein [Levilactobacillus wangkuiensis]|uniref:hypothetical protein n=1 Tax=Levilactobacillus wangkuiensis TaxID=2799566 RepID=UPI001941EAC4|nr:hypothetical protein [Levilactobacillus wangkuiensis]
MKFRKFIMQLGLLLTVVLGFSLVGNCSANAATMPAGAKPVNTASAYYSARSDKGAMYMGQIEPTWSVPTRPKLGVVAANGLSGTNRITMSTTKIYLQVSGSFGMASGATSKIKSIKPEVMRSNMDPNAPAGDAKPFAVGTDLISGSAVPSVTTSGDYYEIDVNLSKLYTLLPLSLGFAITYTNSTKTDYLVYARITEDDALETTWKGTDWLFDPKMYINSTFKATGTGNIKNIMASDKKVTGVGYPGLKIAATLTKGNEDTDYSGDNVSADGTFEIDFPDYIGNLVSMPDTGTTTLGVTEYNDMGDHATAGATINPALKITPPTNSLDIDPDTLEDLQGMSSDNQVLNWIAKQAGVTVSYLGTPYDLSKVTLKSDQTDIATQLAGLANDGSLTVKIGATNSDGVGTTSTADITLKRNAGELYLSHVDNEMDFGAISVPSKETLIAPKTLPQVLVHDTQASGTQWTVLAQTTDLTSTDGNQRKLDGHMVYVDTDGNRESMASAVAVSAGARDRSVTQDVNATDGWSTTTQTLNQPATGMYLDAMPTIFSGSNTTTYQGTIYWELTNAPGSVASTDISADYAKEHGSESSESGGNTAISSPASDSSTSSSSSLPVNNALG